MARSTKARNPRRAAFLQHLLALAILSWSSLVLALPDALDLAADAHQMREKKLPMLVLFSSTSCDWCERARQQVLGPMAADPAAADRVVIRQIDIDRATALTDFSGKVTTHSEFARARKVRMTPTLLVLDADGREISESIVGVRLADFYGTYVERAIDAGLARMRANRQ